MPCGSCGRPIPPSADRIVLADTRHVCMACRDGGVLLKRLPCGHMAMPGTLVITDSADSSNLQCIRCSPHANLPAGMR
jgi:hypothetical protein